MSATSPSRIAATLEFDAETGVGFMPFTEQPEYGEAYFQKYVQYADTTLGVALTSARVGLVSRYLGIGESLLDIGIGDGSFVKARGGPTFGYDVNMTAVGLLRSAGLWWDPDQCDSINAVSFWDVLEHIEKPDAILNKIQSYCFVSMPIYRDRNHIMTSRHFRPDEHCWYFTRCGLIAWFWERDFSCAEMNDMETVLGREDIGTFVFRRR